MLGFDDLQLVSAIARGGSVRRAAAARGEHVATAYRRLRALEARLGQALFETGEGGYLPTPLADDLVGAADEVARTLDEASRRAAGRADTLTGTLRVTTTDTLLPLVVRAVKPFCDAHPDVTLDLAIGNGMADMARHEADVAIRPTRSPPETLIGRKIAAFDFALFAASQDVRQWIGFDESLAGVPAAVWAAEHMPDSARLRLNSFWAAREAAIAGHGIALLPEYLAAGSPLIRIGAAIPALRSEVWLLYHPDLKRSPRVRRFVAAVGPALSSIIGGREPEPGHPD